MAQKRTALSFTEKLEIQNFKASNRCLTDNEIAVYFTEKFKKNIQRRTISNIFHKFNSNGNFHEKKKLKPVQNEDLENELVHWIKLRIQNLYPLNDLIIQTQAIKIARRLNNVNFKGSNGWLQKFKKRHQLKSYSYSGETGDVDIDELKSKCADIKTILSKFEKSEIYNLDETGLFYKISPNKTISDGPVKGRKREMDRISLILCCNSDGTDKIKLGVIGKAKNPRCFKNFNVSALCDYYNNKTAWVTSKEFVDYVTNFNESMKKNNKKVALILDNAPGHSNIQFSNVLLIFIPPNSTGIIQPLDLGIIRSFKASYRKYQVSHLIDNMDPSLLGKTNIYKSITIKNAIEMANFAWMNVKPEVIINCFNASLLFDNVVTDNNLIAEEFNELDQVLEEFDKNTFTAVELLDLENESDLHGNLEDQIEFHTENEKDSNFNDELDNLLNKNDDSNNEIVGIDEAKKAVSLLRNYVFGMKDCNDRYIAAVKVLYDKIQLDSKKISKKTILDYLIPKNN